MGKLRFQPEAKVLNFKLEGHFISFEGKVTEKPKRLLVATNQGERCIKLSKLLRAYLPEVLQPGDWIEISGEQKYKYKTGEVKLKAQQVKLLSSPTPHAPPSTPPASTVKAKATVMICQKSSCRKRGATEVYQAVSKSLNARGLAEQVAIKDTGCMKQCKNAPCLVFMPDKSRYTQVDSKDVPMLVEKHLASKLKPEASKPQLSACPGKG